MRSIPILVLIVAHLPASFALQDGVKEMSKDLANRTPAFDEFQGFYNVPVESMFHERPITDEHRRQVLITVKGRVPPRSILELEGICLRLMAVSDALKPDMTTLHPTEMGSPIEIWFRDDRTAMVGFGDPQQITLENCERIRAAFAKDFPLWRVGVAMAYDGDVILIYPTAIVIPKQWQDRAEEYWNTIVERHDLACENSYETVILRQTLWVEQLMAEMAAQNRFQDSFEPFVIAVFSYNNPYTESGTTINVWFAADTWGAEDVRNSHTPYDITPGYKGSSSDLGLTKSGILEGAPYKLAEQNNLVARCYQLWYDSGPFRRDQIQIFDPKTGQHRMIKVPDEMPIMTDEELKDHLKRIGKRWTRRPAGGEK